MNNQTYNFGTNLSKKMLGLLNELRWLFIGAVGLFLILSLLTHSLNDAAWSVTATQENSQQIHNWAGVIGAWISDILLYFFGHSAWWFVGLLFVLVWRDFWRFWRENDGFGLYGFLSEKFNLEYFKKLKNYAFLSVNPVEIENNRWTNRFGLFVGFVLILLASCTLETLQFHSHGATLPYTSGGIVGYEMALLLLKKFHISYTLLSLLSIIVIFAAWQLFSGMSWLSVFENLGETVDEFLFKDNNKQSNISYETNASARNEIDKTTQKVNDNYNDNDIENVEPEIEINTKNEPKIITENVINENNKVEPTLFSNENENENQISTRNNENFLDESDEQISMPPNFEQFKKINKNLVENDTNHKNNADSNLQNCGEANRFAEAMQQAIQQNNAISQNFSNENSNQNSNEISPSKNIDFSNYNIPIEVLDEISAKPNNITSEQLGAMAQNIIQALANFGISVNVDYAFAGPVIMSYEITPAMGVKGSQIVNLEKDLARALAVQSVRVLETVPGKSCMALELPNPQRQIVQIRELLQHNNFSQLDKDLNIALGKDILGQPTFANLTKMPHLLVAGTTGSGKSIGIHSMIFSLLFKLSPDDLRLILIDPKMLEMSIYNNIPHLLAPVICNANDAIKVLSWCVEEMENRYRIMATSGARNIQNYNQNFDSSNKKLPYIVIVIDELADLMMSSGKQAENLIARLAQKARAAGIHLILATQRPTSEIITTLIKSNIPNRIAFQVSNKADSRAIIEQSGAENLLGNGDMLYLTAGNSNALRIHGAYVSDNEMQNITNYLKNTFIYSNNLENYYDKTLLDIIENNLTNNYGDENLNGLNRIQSLKGGGDILLSDADLELYNKAVKIVLETQKTSATFLQKELGIDYQKTMKFLDTMEKQNILTPPNKRGVRKIVE